MLNGRRRIDSFLRSCHDLASRADDVVPLAAIESVRTLLGKVAGLSHSEELLCRALLQHSIGRIVSRYGPLARDAGACLSAALNHRAARGSWSAELDRLVSAIGLESCGVDHPESVHKILRVIDDRFREPHLKLLDVAAEARLSPCHVSRVLKRHTGSGFVAHVRHRRIVEAHRLLADPLLSMKEIAAAAGFGDASQFTRQFKQSAGASPLRFRASHLAPVPSCVTTRIDKRSQHQTTDPD